MQPLRQYWKIIAGLFWALWLIINLAIQQAQSYDAYLNTRIDTNATDIGSVKDTLKRVDYNIQIIARKVGVVPLKKDSGE